MLGSGCIWKSSCHAKVSGFEKKTFCNSDDNWRNCKHRPANDGNREKIRNHNNAVSNNASVKIFWGVVIIACIVWLITKFMY